MDCLLAIDQGTHASRAVLFDLLGRRVAAQTVPLAAACPRPGWVEQDAEDIFATAVQAARSLLDEAGEGVRVAALGIANQRETLVVWERGSGRALHPAIVWQDRRGGDLCRELDGPARAVRLAERTGLRLDPYFTASKLAWLLREREDLRRAAQDGRLAAGTVDSWLLFRLTGGAAFATEPSNASRTLLYDLERRQFAPDLLDLFGIPVLCLPPVAASAHAFGHTRRDLLGQALPITGVLGDQQAALLGQGCVAEGDVKDTFGTGAFALAQTGQRPRASANGLLTTVAWDLGSGPSYALEGSAFMAGALLDWLCDLGVARSPAELDRMAQEAPADHGVLLIPAHQGLGAPWWEPGARGAILGLTRASDGKVLARAALEAVAQQAADLLDAMRADLGRPLGAVRIDGGLVRSAVLPQWIADLSGAVVERTLDPEATALGAALAAGVGAGVLAPAELGRLSPARERFEPRVDERRRLGLREHWREAVRREGASGR